MQPEAEKVGFLEAQQKMKKWVKKVEFLEAEKVGFLHVITQ